MLTVVEVDARSVQLPPCQPRVGCAHDLPRGLPRLFLACSRGFVLAWHWTCLEAFRLWLPD
eukprot:1983252-Alexandrium_andersonii.AAC.1